MRRRLYGDRHAAVSASLGALSKVLIEQGEVDQAAPMVRESLAIISKLYGQSHHYVPARPQVSPPLRLRQGDRKEALALFEQAVSIGRRVLEADNPRLAQLLLAHGSALCSGSDRRGGRKPCKERVDPEREARLRAPKAQGRQRSARRLSLLSARASFQN